MKKSMMTKKFEREPSSRREWLLWRGGRNEDDVLAGPDGEEYILMQNGKEGEYKVYLPRKFQKKYLINPTLL